MSLCSSGDSALKEHDPAQSHLYGCETIEKLRGKIGVGSSRLSSAYVPTQQVVGVGWLKRKLENRAGVARRKVEK